MRKPNIQLIIYFFVCSAHSGLVGTLALELGRLSEMMSLDLRKFQSKWNPVKLIDLVHDSHIACLGGLSFKITIQLAVLFRQS